MYPAAGIITAPQAALLSIITVNLEDSKEKNAIFARFLLKFKKSGGAAPTKRVQLGGFIGLIRLYNDATSKKED